MELLKEYIPAAKLCEYRPRLGRQVRRWLEQDIPRAMTHGRSACTHNPDKTDE